ncbi:hypothetical protein ACSBR2_026495 [Camellia fascicularis]
MTGFKPVKSVFGPHLPWEFAPLNPKGDITPVRFELVTRIGSDTISTWPELAMIPFQEVLANPTKILSCIDKQNLGHLYLNNRAWRSFQGSSAGEEATSSTHSPSTSGTPSPRDWKETPETHIIKADLPGLSKAEVKVEVEEDGRVLQISGERSQEEEEKTDKRHRVERVRGKFMRRFRLPDNVKMDEIKASMENGVLTVVIPKEQQRKPEVKAIDISG